MKCAYQVFCAGSRKGSRWVPYSNRFATQEEAQLCMRRAEERRVCDWRTDELIRFKIKKINLE